MLHITNLPDGLISTFIVPYISKEELSVFYYVFYWYYYRTYKNVITFKEMCGNVFYERLAIKFHQFDYDFCLSFIERRDMKNLSLLKSETLNLFPLEIDSICKKCLETKNLDIIYIFASTFKNSRGKILSMLSEFILSHYDIDLILDFVNYFDNIDEETKFKIFSTLLKMNATRGIKYLLSLGWVFSEKYVNKIYETKNCYLISLLFDYNFVKKKRSVALGCKSRKAGSS